MMQRERGREGERERERERGGGGCCSRGEWSFLMQSEHGLNVNEQVGGLSPTRYRCCVCPALRPHAPLQIQPTQRSRETLRCRDGLPCPTLPWTRKRAPRQLPSHPGVPLGTAGESPKAKFAVLPFKIKSNLDINQGGKWEQRTDLL